MAEQFTFTFEDSIDMSRSVDLAKAFASLLDQLGPNGWVEYSELIGHSALPKSSAAVRKQQLREFIEKNPSLLERVPGFMPTADTLLDLIESEMGPISEENLVRANRLCRDKVTAIARPMMERFIREGLGSCLDESCDVVTVPVAELIQFLIGDFSEYLKASGNGLVSVAGQLNEKLLQRALQSAGLVEGTDYSVTGTNSNADILIHTQVGARDSLGVEVKSYRARERLLRGLKDVRAPKIGVGFFVDAGEFGPKRTRTLLQAGPAAIYMPTDTLEALHPDARAMTTNETVAFMSALYRPLDRFASDMRNYVESGSLPRFNGAV